MDMMRYWRILLWFLLSIAVLAGGLSWLAMTATGLNTLTSMAGGLSAGRLAISGVEGTLGGPLRVKTLVWTGTGSRVRVDQLELDWRPSELLHGRLHVLRLALGGMSIDTLAPTPPVSLPDSLRLPFALQADALEIGKVAVDGQELAVGLRAVLGTQGGRYRLSGFSGRLATVAAGGQLELGQDAPFVLDGKLHLAGAFREHPFGLDVRADGTLAAVEVSARATEGALKGAGQARLTPFAPTPVSRLHLQFSGVDPADWLQGAPRAALDVAADIEPLAGQAASKTVGIPAVAGHFSVDNREAGGFDRQRLPLRRLVSRLQWRSGKAVFEDLQVEMPGGGRLSGQGSLEAGSLRLALQAAGLDASVFHGKLKPTRLAGSIGATLAAGRQEVTLDLKQAEYALRGHLLRQGESLTAEGVELRAGAARLTAAGHLEGPGQVFAVHGELAHFDPGRFLRGGKGELNGRFHSAGRLQPKPDFKLDFQLEQSRLSGLPLTGQGVLDVAWPTVRHADVGLALGSNRLGARGAYGRPGDSLDVDIQAPRLADLGLEGDVAGTLHLAGTPAAPVVDGRLASRIFVVPGLLRTEGADVRVAIGASPADPLRVEVKLASARGASASAIEGLSLHVAGSRRQHQLTAGARLPGERQVELTAEGGLADDLRNPLWTGRLTALQVRGQGQALRLSQPAALRLGSAAWSLGPAELAAADWRGTLRAVARDGSLHAEASAVGERFGGLSASLDAALLGAWSLDRARPWKAEMAFHLPDLRWLGAVLGNGVQTAGTLDGSLSLGGTPAAPVATGQARGDKLGLALADQGLRLENGMLAAGLQDNRLRVDTLAFDSRLQPPPRAVPAENRADFAAVAARPGRLEVKGEMQLGGFGAANGADRAFLDVKMARVGVLQSVDQWIAVSGKGRLDWQAGALALAANLKVDAGFWQLARMGTPKLSDDVIVKSTKAAAPATPRTGLGLDVSTDLGEHFFFSGAGLESRLEGSVRIVAQGRDLPRASGSIQTAGGRFDAYGQKLAIERGVINFQGLPDNPALNVRALRKGLAVEAGVEVTGTAKRPLVRLVSDPEVSDAEKLSWLVLGRDSSELGGGDAGLLLSAAGSILGGNSGGVLQRLKQGFGVDELGVRSGQLGASGERAATSRVVTSPSASSDTAASSQIVSVGKRLSSNMVLSYEQALGKTESLVKLTVSLSRRLSLVGRAGSDNALDLLYTWSFGKQGDTARPPGGR